MQTEVRRGGGRAGLAGGQRIALVTGGTDGIGKAIAQVLATHGVGVVVVGSNAGKGAAAVRELRRLVGQ